MHTTDIGADNDIEMNYPSEIHRLLKIGDNLVINSAPQMPPHDLPIAAVHALPVPAIFAHDDIQIPEQAGIREQIVAKLKENSGVLIYPAIFLAAFIFFYMALNFPSLITQVSGWFAKPQDEQLLGDNLTEYYSWMYGYYFSVGSKDLLEPANDIDKDGLSNMDEFQMKTNPTIADSDGDGTSDGVEIINGTNPWGDGVMTSEQVKLAASLDIIRINNRISFNLATSNINPAVLGTTKINYDLEQPGRLSIPRLNIQVPIIWTKDPKDFEVDLTKGVVHYPGTALPGEQGTVYVSGHSSDYPWKRHPYKQIFAGINVLSPGDDIFVDIYGSDGKIYNYRYRVASSNIYKPNDQTQFIDNSGAKLNLSTCWPIGTAKDRYVVTAVLGGV